MIQQATVRTRPAAILPLGTGDFKSQLRLLADPSLQEPAFLADLLAATAAEIDTRPGAMIESLFIKAILDRVQPEGEDRGHIYLKQYEIPQIVLFDLLTHHYPFVSASHAIANEAIARQLAGSSHPVLLDAGIGRGMQTLRLLELLKANDGIRHLTIIGVEPFADALDFVTGAMAAIAPELPFGLTFIPLHSLVEDLQLMSLQQCLPLYYDRLVVNSSLTLHHTKTAGCRQDFFDTMAALKADAVVLIEPDSNLMQEDWESRMLQAYTHYQAVFDVIDQLPVGLQEKNGLKLFFGREIDDAVAQPAASRFERHEEGAQWVEYLQKAGFCTAAPEPQAAMPTPVTALPAAGYCSLAYENIPMLSVIQAIRP